MVRVEKEYRFEGPEGERSLLDLFEGRRQLIVYRFFLDPGMTITEYPKGCPGCTMFADNLPNLTHLKARDTTLVFVSGGSQEAIRDYRARMGWADWPDTTLDDFSADFDAPSGSASTYSCATPTRLPQLLHDLQGRRGPQQHLGAARHHAVRPPGGVAGRPRGRPAGRHRLMDAEARRLHAGGAGRRQDELLATR